ncbi:MAG: RNA methyltransferase, partial [Bacteroidota bacterium]|nr:RNA methyltransferase [Bacteroidota bacterium]
MNQIIMYVCGINFSRITMCDPSSPEYKKAFLAYLETFLTEERLEKFDRIARNRTRYVTVVLEDIYQAHNASAVVRSCECFGIQDLYFIENLYEYHISPDVTMGSTKWLNVNRYNKPDTDNTTACIMDLKEKGYRIYATTPHTHDCLIQDLPLTEKTALVFGTELEGISETALKLADGFVRIPMYGFTESYNISVSAALCMFSMR